MKVTKLLQHSINYGECLIKLKREREREERGGGETEGDVGEIASERDREISNNVQYCLVKLKR